MVHQAEEGAARAAGQGAAPPEDTRGEASGPIGILVPQFPGQTHIFFWREIAALERRGAQVQLFSTRPPPPGLIAHAWSAEAAARCIYLMPPSAADLIRGAAAFARPRLHRLLGTDAPALRRDLALCLPAAFALRRRAAERGVAHVHVHSCGRAALIAALSRALGGPSYSLTLHGPMQDYGPGQRTKWRGARFGSVITRRLEGELRAALGEDTPPLAVQPMGVEPARFARPEPYRPPEPGAPLRLFSCARLNRVKGHEEVLEAVALLRAEGRDVRLEIAGEDDAGGSGYRGTLEARRAALGLEGAVTLLGAVDEGVVRAKLHGAHAFVLASWAEPLGVAYMEAMAAGVPVIGTDAGGAPELIRNGTDGLLVPPRDVKALAAAIAGLAEDPGRAQRLARAGAQRVAEGFTSDRGAEMLLRMLAAHPAR